MSKGFLVGVGGGGGVSLDPLTNPAAATDILVGKKAYDDSGNVIVGAYEISDVHPQLNAVSISKNNNNLNITNPSTNGNFVAGYKVFSEGTEVTRVTNSPLVLTTLQAQPYVLTVRADGVGFTDSNDSNSLTITVYAFVDGLENTSSDFDFAKTTSGMTFSFVIAAEEGYHLPSSISIKCNGEELEYTYNPYTGEVEGSMLKTAYSGTVTDGGQLVTPVIALVDEEFLSVSDVPFAEIYTLYDGDNLVDSATVTSGGYIGVSAVGVETPQLMAPYLSLDEDTLKIVDGYLMQGDVLYSETYDLYVDDAVYATGIDATTDQNVIISYKLDPANQWVKQSDGGYKTSTSSSYANTYAYMRVLILTPRATQIKVSYTFYPYSSYVRMYAGKLDQAFEKSVTKTPTSSQYQVASSGSSTTTSSYVLDCPAGAHFIDFIKQYNTTSTSSSYYSRYMIVKVEEVVATA